MWDTAWIHTRYCVQGLPKIASTLSFLIRKWWNTGDMHSFRDVMVLNLFSKITVDPRITLLTIHKPDYGSSERTAQTIIRTTGHRFPWMSVEWQMQRIDVWRMMWHDLLVLQHDSAHSRSGFLINQKNRTWWHLVLCNLEFSTWYSASVCEGLWKASNSIV